MKCFDPSCKQLASHPIRGLKACTEHYIEALEHSAHITSLVSGLDHPIPVSMPTPKKVLDRPPVL